MSSKPRVKRVSPATAAVAAHARPITGEWPPEAGPASDVAPQVVAPRTVAVPKVRAPRRTSVLTWVAALVLLAALAWPLLRLPAVMQLLRPPPRWEFFLREPWLQQLSGFAVLSLFLFGLLLPLRRKLGKRGIGSRDAWRVAHVALGVVLCAGLVAHSGARLGRGSNLALSVAVLALVAVGGVLGLAWRRTPPQPRFVGRRVRPLHVTLLWPTLGLIAAHVLIVYYF
jgi:nitrite reductase (NADH) large subunit